MRNISPVFTVAATWIAWCAMHSLLITHRVTGWVHRKLRERFVFYRLAYVLFSVITLAPVVAYQFSVEQQHIFAWHGAWRLLQGVLLLYAAGCFWGGVMAYDVQYVLGIRQYRLYRTKQRESPMPFRTSGILHCVRHPWYSGGIALLWSVGAVTDVSLAAKAILTGYLIAGSILEERKLVVEIGEPYRRYRRQVPMLMPWKFFKRFLPK